VDSVWRWRGWDGMDAGSEKTNASERGKKKEESLSSIASSHDWLHLGQAPEPLYDIQ
jgi:hypothetical protein